MVNGGYCGLALRSGLGGGMVTGPSWTGEDDSDEGYGEEDKESGWLGC